MNVLRHVADTGGAVLLFAGSAICLLGVIGLLRLPDVLTRSHAATKPQAVGILLVLAGVALRLRIGMDMGTIALVCFFQLLTSPVASHLVARAAYRTGETGREGLLWDDLDRQLSRLPRQSASEAEQDTAPPP